MGGDRVHYFGEPIGFVIELRTGSGSTTRDTTAFGDMALIRELYSPDLAIIPIGGHFTMDPAAAAVAVGLLGVRDVIPVHWGKFPILAGTPAALVTELGARGIEANVVDWKPGESADYPPERAVGRTLGPARNAVSPPWRTGPRSRPRAPASSAGRVQDAAAGKPLVADARMHAVHDHEVGLDRGRVGDRHHGHAVLQLHGRDERVGVVDVGAARAEPLEQLEGRRLAHVLDARLVGDAHDHHAGAADRDALVRQVADRPIDDLARAAGDALHGALQDRGGRPLAAQLPQQVVRIARDAVAADADAGVERHEAVRLRGCRRDDLVELEAERQGRRLHLVRERDVHGPEEFSSSLVNSAASVELTVWTGVTRPITSAARRTQAGDTPPTTRGTTAGSSARGPDRCARARRPRTRPCRP